MRPDPRTAESRAHRASSKSADTEISATRKYLQRVLELLADFKKRKVPEARLSGELVAKKMGDYCPQQLDDVNVLSLYRRMTPDGTLVPASAMKKK